MAGRQEGQVGLGLAVEGGGDVDEGLVMQQLGEIAVGKAGAPADADRLGGRQGIGGEAVHQFDGGRLVAEMGAHRALEIHRHLLGTVIGRRGRGDVDVSQLVDGVQDALRQLQGRYRRITQGRRGLTVELAAELEKAGGAHRRQHPRPELDGLGMSVQPDVDGRKGHDLAAGLAHQVDAGRGVERRIGHLWQFPATARQESLLHLGRPVEGAQDADGFAGLVQQAGYRADAILLAVGGGGHGENLRGFMGEGRSGGAPP